MTPETRSKLIGAVIILLVILLSVFIYLERDAIRALGAWGYPGIFLVGLVASAAMFAPMPGLVVLAASASALDPFLAGMLFATGAALGELSGYLAGLGSKRVIQRNQWYDRLERWMAKYGPITIVFLGFIPNVLIDVAGMIAGAAKMPWYKFLFWCWLGKVPKCLLITYGFGAIFLHAAPPPPPF